MADKPKCSVCNEREVFAKGMCSGCYGKEWREQRKAERAAAIAEQFPPRRLTSGVTEAELEPIEPEVMQDGPPETHLTATNPVEMAASREDIKAGLERKLTVIEREIVEANRALNEARRNGWNTSVLTSARNRLVDDETYYNKVLAAVEAGHTIIPEFPIDVFAVRRHESDKRDSHTWTGHVNKSEVWLSNPVDADYAPVGAGEYRNPKPEVSAWYGSARKNQEGKEYFPYTVQRTGRPVGPIIFPSITARSPVMKAAAAAMADKVFDRVGVCRPVTPNMAAQRAQANAGRAGDPLVIGQVVRKGLGGRHKVVSFIIAWYLNLDEL